MSNLSRLSLVERTQYVKDAADQAACIAKTLFPESEGYRHRIDITKPFHRKRYAIAYRVTVQRDWLWGFCYGIAPRNAEITAIKRRMLKSSTLLDRVKAVTNTLCAFGAVATAVVLLIAWLVSGFGFYPTTIPFLSAFAAIAIFLIFGLPMLLAARLLMALHQTTEDAHFEMRIRAELESEQPQQGESQ